MRLAIVTILLTFVGAAVHGSPPTRTALEREVLAATKRLAKAECHVRHADDGAVTRCEYSPAFIDGTWSVLVRHVLVLKDGTRAYAPGAFTLYKFDAAGKFVEAMPGM